jgi:hypothetical protein
MKTRVITLVLQLALLYFGNGKVAAQAVYDAAPPAESVKLIFIHHSSGENWLSDDNGGLGIALRDNNYFVSDTNYGWGPNSIGDRTDIGNWWEWFQGPDRDTYLNSLYTESSQHSSYSRMNSDPGGQNQIIMFKSCFPNSNLTGNSTDPPTTGSNPLRGESSSSEYMTVANAKGIYNDLLEYFATRQDKLFIAITAPPLSANDTDTADAANARAFNDWLVNDWLDSYPYNNVAVFDFYNVLTSNGGNTNTNDLGSATGNHHRWRNNAVEHIQTVDSNVSAYPSGPDDSHATAAGNQKATAEFVDLLNYYYDRWMGNTTTCNSYDFRYTYGNGDYYTGTVYASPGYGYSTSYTQSLTDENNQTGTYTITGVTTGQDVSKAGQVYVTSYYDSESGNTYTPVSNGSAVGSSYLGSEHDYIIQTGIADFYFGGGYYEADTGAYSRYNFYYWYSDGSGDCYAGYVYAPTGWFTADSKIYYQPLPMGGAALGGCYYITSATAGYTSAYDKQSYITTYYDYHNSAWTACGVNKDGSTTAGSSYLADRSQAAETGYAVYGSQAKSFDTSSSAALTYSASMPAYSQAVWEAYWSQAADLLEEGT